MFVYRHWHHTCYDYIPVVFFKSLLLAYNMQPFLRHIFRSKLCVLYVRFYGMWFKILNIFMPPHVLVPISSFNHYQTCECNILKVDRLILMQIYTSAPWGKGIKPSTLGVTGSMVKVAQGQNMSQKSHLTSYLKHYATKFNQTWQAHLAGTSKCLLCRSSLHGKVRVTWGLAMASFSIHLGWIAFLVVTFFYISYDY